MQSKDTLALEPDQRGVILPVRGHAGSRRNAIEGVRQGMLHVAVTDAPEKGKPNKAIIALLSKTFGVPKSTLMLISGKTSPEKRFLVVGANVEQLRSTLAQVTDND